MDKDDQISNPDSKKGVLKNVAAWVIRPSFTKDNWNPGKGSLDMLDYVKPPTEGTPLKYEDVIKAYDYTADKNNEADIARIRNRRNVYFFMFVIYTCILIISYERTGVFTPLVDFFIFGIPSITLILASIIMDYFLKIAITRKTMTFFEYLLLKGGVSNGR